METTTRNFPRGYRPEIHDRLSAHDAAMDIADDLYSDDDMLDLRVHELTQQINKARAF